MAINFPTWITDGTVIPGAFLVPAKKALYTFAACEYARRLIIASYGWVRGATETVPDPQSGEVLTAEDITLLTDAFPTQWASYPPVPSPPPKATVDSYHDAQWQPRQSAAQGQRAVIRRAASSMDLTWVDWQGMI